ncbi:[protein-PII] uridylyltransferase [bacterium]|nr:[protein-PII] uridylyltransferase [bacterium]
MTTKKTEEATTLEARLTRARDRLAQQHGHRSGKEVVRRYSEDIDRLIQTHINDLIRQNPEFKEVTERCVLIATGGYGRRELNLHSDIDLLFLFREEPTEVCEEFIRAFLYPMWNLKIDLGYGIKTLEQAYGEICSDLDFTTSMTGIHPIWGNEEIAQQLQDHLRIETVTRKSSKVMDQILSRMYGRHLKHSDTLLLLEPNIKDARGGLRDFHVILWAAFCHFGQGTLSILTNKGLLTTREERSLRRAHSFLLELRNGLHLMEGRKTDALNFERQMKLAPELGHDLKAHVLPEEQLMRSYYEHVGAIDRLLGRLLKRLSSEESQSEAGRAGRLRRRRIEGEFWTRDNLVWVDPREVNTVVRNPDWMMHLFTVCAQRGLLVDDFTLNLVEQHLHEIDEAYRRSPLNRDRFLGILRNPKQCIATLRQMHACRFLDTYLPEFALVRNLPRIDYYHQFTVDEHLLRSVECAGQLVDHENGFYRSHAGSVARDLLRWDLLVFALLFHDVGKGEGRGHVIRGSHMIQRIAERLSMTKKETEILYQLVLNHQRMSFMALRRNPEDPKVPEELAKDISDPELLRMLYVLTCCDLRSVSEQSWNDWRGSLLSSLFERAMDFLRGEGEKIRRSAPSHRSVTEKVMKEVQENPATGEEGSRELRREEVEEFLRDMPSRYRRSTPPQLVARHVRMTQRLNEQELVTWELEQAPGSSYAILHCVASDNPGLFCNLCGALASRGFNILSAQIYTAKNGVCVDVFQIQDADRQPPSDIGALERLRVKLNQVLLGERPGKWKDLLPRRAQPISAARLDQFPPSVSISNDDSTENYTVLEVKAPDRPGLLYDITSLLDQHRLNIHLALIATESYQGVDVFYITDWENNRLEKDAKTEAFREELLEVVSPDSTIGAEEESAS